MAIYIQRSALYLRKIAFLLLLVLVFKSEGLFAKVRVLTFHYNKPEFIELQHKCFKAFFQDDFEIIVFNDAKDERHKVAIDAMCELLEIECVRFEQEWHKTDPLNFYLEKWLENPKNDSYLQFSKTASSLLESIYTQPSIRHCHVIQYALDHYGYCHDDIVIIMDADAFPIRPFSIKKILGENDIAAIRRVFTKEKIDYLWVVFIAFNPLTLPNLEDFKCHADVVKAKLHDTGSHTYHYLKNNPSVKVLKYDGQGSSHLAHQKIKKLLMDGFSQDEAWLIKNLPYQQCVEFHLDKLLLHFGASSFELEGHELKSVYVKRFLDEIVKKNTTGNKR